MCGSRSYNTLHLVQAVALYISDNGGGQGAGEDSEVKIVDTEVGMVTLHFAGKVGTEVEHQVGQAVSRRNNGGKNALLQLAVDGGSSQGMPLDYAIGQVAVEVQVEALAPLVHVS